MRRYRLDICEMRLSYGLSCHNCYHFETCTNPKRKVPWEDNVDKIKSKEQNKDENIHRRAYHRHKKLSNSLPEGRGVN